MCALIIYYPTLDMQGSESYDPDDISKMKNNTIIGEDFMMDDKKEMLKSMLEKGMVNLPGATPMNT